MFERRARFSGSAILCLYRQLLWLAGFFNVSRVPNEVTLARARHGAALAVIVLLAFSARGAVYTFGTCGASGNPPPTQAACDAAYASTNLAGAVTVTGGIQRWTVPASGTYRITATGAWGRSAQPGRQGGRGARLSGSFTLTAGEVLQLLVGQTGEMATNSNGGGGGGTFVVTSANSPLLVAGGGGGTRVDAWQNGCDASISAYGIMGSGGSSTSSCSPKGTASGQGGIVSSYSWGSGGGGFYSAGQNDGWGQGGSSWASGMLGGAVTGCGGAARGGFGGGGSGNGCYGGGGGGGYSGGDGGLIAGGGGSWNTGADPSATAGVGVGNGSLTIESLVVNAPPSAVDDSVATSEDLAVNIAVLTNDTDPNGDPLTFAVVTGPSNGTLSPLPGGLLLYTPGSNYYGSDSFTYKANDGTSDSGTATVSITIAAVNDPPEAGAGVNATDEDQAVNGALSATDVDGDALTYSVVSDGSKGTVTITNAATGAYTYVPNADENGSDSFTFKANDGTADSNPAIVSITIAAVNDAPVAAEGNLSTDEDTSANGILTATDADGNALTYSIVSNGSKGTVTITDAVTGAYTYVPAADENGSDSFTFKANDGTADSNTATVSITIAAIDDAPVAADGTLGTDEDASANGTLTATDVDSSSLTYAIVSNGSKGTVTITDASTGAYTYVPNANENGSDSFTFKANDGSSNSNTATVSITIAAVNDAPVAAEGSLSTDEDTSAGGTLGGSDVDGDALTYSIVSSGSKGTVTITNASTGAYTYVPNTDENGSDSFTFKANDGTTDSNTATISITIVAVNDPPVAADGSLVTDEDTSANGSLAAIDVDSTTLTYSVVTNGSKGTVTITDAATGAYTYVPNANANGSDSFTFKANDGAADSNVATVAVTINPVNDAPELDSIANDTKPWNELFSFDANATDVDAGDTLTFSLSGAPTGASIDPSTGVFTWTPSCEQIASHTFSVVVTDNGSPVLSDSQSVTLTVTRRATTLVYNGDTAGQYSDPALVRATLRDAATNAPLGDQTVTFDLASLTASDETDGSGIAESSIILDLDPTLNGYLIESEFAGDNCYAPSSDSDAFDVTQEDARVTYTGALFVGTACTTCDDADVTLAATVEGATTAGLDPDTGDILNATLTFVNRDNNQVLCTATLGLVGSDPELATGTCTWDANIGNSDSDDFTIGVIVGGWYTRNSTNDDTVVTISKPIAANFITGGGYLVLQSSAGQYAGDRDTKTNFGFSVKYNKSGKNLQGRINTLVRSGGRTYQIKGNVMSSLAVQTAAGTATFNGKASITDITDPLNPVAVDGNSTLQVTMTDMGEPGSNDSIGITVWNKQGGLWFASAWDGTQTTEQALDGGNLVVR